MKRVCGSKKARLFAMCMVVTGVFLCSKQRQAVAQDSVDPQEPKKAATRPVTVDDMIEMSQPGENLWINGSFDKHRIAKFSPDGRTFIVVVKRGDIATNTNQYTVLLFNREKAMTGNDGIPLVTMASSSNRPAIQQVEWLDNQTLSFLGEAPGKQTQLYTLDISTKRLKERTNHESSLITYAITRTGQSVFLAEEPPTTLGETLRGGESLVVETQPLLDLLTKQNSFAHEFFEDLYVQDSRSAREERIHVGGRILIGTPLSV